MAELADILNNIRNSATVDYQRVVPLAENNNESCRAIGNIVMQYQIFQNQFVDALVNRIAYTIITSRMAKNPLSVFKKAPVNDGMGFTIEDVFIDMAKGYKYDGSDEDGNYGNVYQQFPPDIKTAFYSVNVRAWYPVTLKEQDIKQAFTSRQGMLNTIQKIVDTCYSGWVYDSFNIIKYLIARRILNGQVKVVQIPNVSAGNYTQVVSTIKGVSNAWELFSSEYNIAGVKNFCPKQDQSLIESAAFNATIDVEVLAVAFNMDKTEFLARQIMIDNFGVIDNERLQSILGDDYIPLTEAEKQGLNNIPAVLIDDNFIQNYESYEYFRENYNGRKTYWNYFFHTGEIACTSPFANIAVFVQGAPEINSVTVSPKTANLTKGGKILLSAIVDTNNYASQAVTWASDNENVAVDVYGNVYVGSNATGTATITATSRYDSSKTDTAEITIIQ